jgi:phosphoglycolate phosphatase
VTVSIDRFRLIVFDLDGTLVDSLRDIADSANALLHSCGAEALPEAQIGRMVGDGAATLIARAFAAAVRTPPPDALPRFLTIYNERLLQYTRVYPGMLDVLDALQSRATLAVLTNKPLAATRRILDGLELARYFAADAVIGGDGPFARKPDPDGLRHLSSAAGASADETLLVGDSIIDWRTARHASTSICLARYGFGYQNFPEEQLGSLDRVIDRPCDLLKL